jgi:hypothetical protein
MPVTTVLLGAWNMAWYLLSKQASDEFANSASNSAPARVRAVPPSEENHESKKSIEEINAPET